MSWDEEMRKWAEAGGLRIGPPPVPGKVERALEAREAMRRHRRGKPVSFPAAPPPPPATKDVPAQEG